MNEIKSVALSPDRESMRRTLKAYIESKLLPAHIKTVDQAEVIVGIGREIGLPAIASMRTIHLINGAPTVSPAMMLALANKRGLIVDQSLQKFDDYVIFTIRRKDRQTAHSERFGKKEALALGLMSKDNYKKQPITMFAWRAISAAMRFMFPDVIFGLYTPEEMGAIIDIDPENELEAKTVTEDKADKKVTFVEAAEQSKEIEAQVEKIKERLAAHAGGDIGAMNSTLLMLTEHRDPATGETMFVELSELDELAKDRPKWIPAILKKMDQQGIGVSGSGEPIVAEVQS